MVRNALWKVAPPSRRLSRGRLALALGGRDAPGQPAGRRRYGSSSYSLLAYFRQHLRFDISAADHRYIYLRARQLVAMKQECSHGHGPAGLGNRLGIGSQKLHGLADFVLAHGHDVIHVASNVFKVDRTDTLCAQSVRQSSGSFLGRGLHDLAGSQAGLRIGREFRFRANHLYAEACSA